MRETAMLNSKTTRACVLGLFLAFSISFLIPASYAEELTYDEKLEFVFKTEQIASHMISALDNIIQKEYGLAKMHLVHPSAEHHDIVDLLSEESECSKKLPLVLTMLQHTEPEFDRDVTEQRFSYVFQVLRDCNDSVAATSLNANLNFNIDLIDKILEKSAYEYELSSQLTGHGRIMEYQDALSLVMRSHMLVNSSDVFDSEKSIQLRDDFKDLFLAYQNESAPAKVAILTNDLRSDVRNLNDSPLFSDSDVRYDLITPTVYLQSMDYSADLILLELRGENFDNNQKVTVEYVHPIDNVSESVSGSITSGGTFHFPLEFIDRTFDEPMMFTITVGSDTFFEVLSIS